MGRERKARLVVALGDQLSTRLASFEGFDRQKDSVWMAEVCGESEYVWNSKHRIVLFLSAMRHFRDALREEGYSVFYRELGDEPGYAGLGEALGAFLEDSDFGEIVMTEPGEYRLVGEIESACAAAAVRLKVLSDNSFYATKEDFDRHAKGRKQLRMEYFYREQRKRFGVLMDGGSPTGGTWNYDSSNRSSFGKEGPETLLGRKRFSPDGLTREVMEEVSQRFAGHPGKLDTFAWPVTRGEALEALRSFVEDELARFGKYQDAMWKGEPFLSHSLLASSLNLHLLDAREVVEAAEKAYRSGGVPVESVEGFIRQILGWREYVRGVYWRFMPEYLERNALGASEPLPKFYWTGDTELACLKDAIGQTLEYGYAHHIQRLMVTGLYTLLLGVEPKEVHKWYLAVYVDAVEWVELPNTLGMSQFGDGGVMGSKPYVASGKYIDRMSNYCGKCRFDPAKRTGENACPFTTLYWDFLIRHKTTLKSNPRMSMQLRNVDRLGEKEVGLIREKADAIRRKSRKEN